MTAAPVRTAEVVAALALASDLSTGQPADHALRCALLATRLGRLAGADETTLADSFYVALLHASGCTSDAHELAAAFGDDIFPRADFARVDVANVREVIAFLGRHAGAGAPPLRRAAAFGAALAAGARRTRRGYAMHCEVAQRFAERLQLSEGTAAALEYVFERWDGKGLPAGARGASLPLPARLLHIARDACVFGSDAPGVIADRAARAYDPELAALFVRNAADLIDPLAGAGTWVALLDEEPGLRPTLAGDSLDQACSALADFVDLKSPWWRGHSRAVAELGEAAAWRMGLAADDVALVRRAALVHDLGRAGISNAVWEKAGTLGLAEWEQVRLHPLYTERAFASGSLAPLGELAAMHHERLDGTGYHRRLPAQLLPRTARILAAADAYQAMAEPRPYRDPLGADRAAAELQAEVRAGRLDPGAVDAVLAAAGHRTATARRLELPDGLSERELEVLRLVTGGHTNKQIGALLHLSPKTIGHHVQHIYAKIGVSSRAAATLYAAERGLLRE